MASFSFPGLIPLREFSFLNWNALLSYRFICTIIRDWQNGSFHGAFYSVTWPLTGEDLLRSLNLNNWNQETVPRIGGTIVKDANGGLISDLSAYSVTAPNDLFVFDFNNYTALDAPRVLGAFLGQRIELVKPFSASRSYVAGSPSSATVVIRGAR